MTTKIQTFLSTRMKFLSLTILTAVLKFKTEITVQSSQLPVSVIW